MVRDRDWQAIAERRLKKVLVACQARPTLKRRGPRPPAYWDAGVQIVGEEEMRKLNSRYRGKRKATDVLSFPAPDLFWEAGFLGELAICEPVLARQARGHGHAESAELDLLLVHGVLHLLGLDHERGEKHELEMSDWEKKLLRAIGHSLKKTPGLIARARLRP